MPPSPAAAVAALRVLVAAWALGECYSTVLYREASTGGPSPRPPPQPLPLQTTANPSDCHIEPYGPGGCDRARQPVFVVVSTQRSGTHFLAQQLVATGAVCKPAQTNGRPSTNASPRSPSYGGTALLSLA